MIKLIKKLFKRKEDLYVVQLWASIYMVTTIPVYAIIQRKGYTIYHCKMSAPLDQPATVVKSCLIKNGVFVEESKLDRPMQCLKGSRIQFYHVSKKD